MHNFNKSFQKILLLVSLLCTIIILISGFMLLRHFGLSGGSSNAATVDAPPRDEIEQDFLDELDLPEDLIYDLPRGATALQLELFAELFDAHDRFNRIASEVNLVQYASTIAQNFVADFFTLSNKTSRNDIGGLQFLADDIFEYFYDYVLNTFYLHLNHHITNFGSDSLPTVGTITVLNSESILYALSIDEYPGTEDLPLVQVDLEWTYLSTTLPYINEFQTSARILLQEINGEIRIRSIMEIPIENDSESANY